MATTEDIHMKDVISKGYILRMWEWTIHLSLGRFEWHVAEAGDNVVEHNLTTL